MAMSSGGCVDQQHNCQQPRGFLTPPPTWKTNRRSPVMPRSEMKAQPRGDLFHIIHKIPSGDSPYVRAKHVQLVDKDPSRAISLFWQAINAGDRVDSALKDMAVVMKQLNRSDEAIEAIKSFRHLSPPESQESIDNILVELYKQSGRMEEEIELLQFKLKQLEEGMAFSGRKTKIARSQGKKVHITVQKEYSRLLGNLAWAYMQQQDYKSAEEHYRKALSFEPDKNKQCNLAVCLMHMNKLTEAKFLLQAIPSDNGAVDESYAKSFERASEILAEFEEQNVLKPIKQDGETGIARRFVDGNLSKTKPFGGQWVNNRFCPQKLSSDSNGTLSSPQPSSAKIRKGGFTDFAYEKRADFDWRLNRHEAGGNTPKVPFTQPRRCWRNEDQRKAGFAENSNGSYCRKLSFGSSVSSESVHSFASQNVDCYSHNAAPDVMPNILPRFLERRGTTEKPLDEANEEGKSNNPAYDCKKSGVVEELLQKNPAGSCKLESKASNEPSEKEKSRSEQKKSWADMVEEEELVFGSWANAYPLINLGNKSSSSDEFSDENVDSNIIPGTPKLHTSEEMGSIDLGGGYLTQPEKKDPSKNQPLRRSLCFDQNLLCASLLTTKALDYQGQDGGGLHDDLLGSSDSKNRRRLQVFQDITRAHGSP